MSSLLQLIMALNAISAQGLPLWPAAPFEYTKTSALGPALDVCPVNEGPGQTVNSAAVCPWKYELDTDENRSPVNILTAVGRCQSCLDPYTLDEIIGTTCKSVEYKIPVSYGEKSTNFTATVAFVCLRVKIADVHPPTTKDPRPTDIIP